LTSTKWLDISAIGLPGVPMKSFFDDLFFLFSRNDLFRFSLLLLLLVLGTFVELFSLATVPLFVGILTDSGGESAVMRLLQDFFLQFEGGADYAFQIRWSSLAFVALFAFRALYLYLSCSLQQRILKNRCVELGSRIFSAYMAAPYTFLLRGNSQDMVNNVIVESDRLVNRVLGPVINLLRALVVMGGVVAMLLFYTPLITLFALTSLLIFGGGYLHWNRQNNKRHGEAEAASRKEAMSVVAEGIGGFKEIRISGCGEFFRSRLHAALEKVCASQRWLEVDQTILWPFLELVTVTVLVVSTMLALGFAEQEFASFAPAMALFAVALFRLKGYVTEAILNFSMLRYNLISMDIICRDLRTLQGAGDSAVCSLSKRLDTPVFREQVCVENLEFSYDNTVLPALQDVSLSIARGSSVALVGATGSGKSTLLDLLLGLLEPTQGRILVDGCDIRENLAGWQSQIGYVPQQIFLLDQSLRANVALGVPENEIDEARLRQAIRAAQLEEFVSGLPDGDRTRIGERGVRLSGGQRQRIGVARALYGNPAILVFDEATSALDTLTEEALTEAVERLRGDHTVIVVAHRLTTVQKADCLFFLEKGKLIASGSYEQLCEKNADFRAMAKAGYTDTRTDTD
jgi:ABC-type multidrug transport system fused ATPase/permease subunit